MAWAKRAERSLLCVLGTRCPPLLLCNLFRNQLGGFQSADASELTEEIAICSSLKSS